MTAAWPTAGDGPPLFADRADAGRRLGRRLRDEALDTPVVVALPRGGVPVAAEVAEFLHAPLDVLVVRKLGCPWHPELGFGAIGEGGVRLLDHRTVTDLGLTDDEVEAVTEHEAAELARRVARYRGTRPPIALDGRTVVLVDDGVATGSTARVAIAILRARGVDRIVLAVPVGPPDRLRALAAEADDVVALSTPASFLAVGAFYRDFGQTPDQEVVDLLWREPDDPPEDRWSGQFDAPRDAVVADHAVTVLVEGVRLAGRLIVPSEPVGFVVFAHGSGSGRLSPRNRAMARVLNDGRLATLSIDLLTPEEARRRANVFDVRMLGRRLAAVVRWEGHHSEVDELPIGLYGSSASAAAALVAAADLGHDVGAVVARGGRPDLAGTAIGRVVAPTLLVVGARDHEVVRLDRQVARHLRCPHRLEVVAGAGHLFDEPGVLEQVSRLARDWFVAQLSDPGRADDTVRSG